MTPRDGIEIRVRPRNLRWEVSINGVTRRMVDWLCTKERAIQHATNEAHWLLEWEVPQATATIMVERSDWTEEERFVVAKAERRAS